MSVILVFIPATAEKTGFPTIENLFPGLSDRSGLLFLRNAQRQDSDAPKKPDVVFVPEDGADAARKSLLRVLPDEIPIAAAIHLGSGQQSQREIVDLLHDLECEKKARCNIRFFHRSANNLITDSIIALAIATKEGNHEAFASGVQALLDACQTNWDLEAKLALLHACLVPVSEGPPLKPNTPLAGILAAAGLPEREVGRLSDEERFWNRKIQKATVALRKPGAYGGFTDEYQAALTALREMLLPDL